MPSLFIRNINILNFPCDNRLLCLNDNCMTTPKKYNKNELLLTADRYKITSWKHSSNSMLQVQMQLGNNNFHFTLEKNSPCIRSHLETNKYYHSNTSN